MATSLRVPIVQCLLQWTFQDTQAFGDTTNNGKVSHRIPSGYTDGTGAGKANKVYSVSHTLAAGATLTLDLNGALTDVYQNIISFTKIKALYCKLTKDTPATALTLGGSSQPFDDWLGGVAAGKLRLKNGYGFLLAGDDANGYTVANGVSDQLLLTNEDGGAIATYELVIIGE